MCNVKEVSHSLFHYIGLIRYREARLLQDNRIYRQAKLRALLAEAVEVIRTPAFKFVNELN